MAPQQRAGGFRGVRRLRATRQPRGWSGMQSRKLSPPAFLSYRPRWRLFLAPSAAQNWPHRLLRTLSSDLVLVQNVSKLYRLYRRPADRLQEMLPGARSRHTDFWALRDINFSVEKGEMLGLVGPNGCGKSTLLQIVSGILQPTTGRVVTRGRIAALLRTGRRLQSGIQRTRKCLSQWRDHGAEPGRN